MLALKLGLRFLFAGAMFPALLLLACVTRPALVSADAPQVEVCAHPGKTLMLNCGGCFVVRLPANPTTGYGWQLALPLNERIVVLVTNDYIAPATQLVGAGGEEVWSFKAVGRGRAEIAFRYVRPWEKNRPPAKTNCLQVVVQ